MKSIYRCSKYGFLEIEDKCQMDKADIELAVLCVSGVYGACFAVDDKRLHVIFNPERTSIYEINCAIVLTGHKAYLDGAEKNTGCPDRKKSKNSNQNKKE